MCAFHIHVTEGFQHVCKSPFLGAGRNASPPAELHTNLGILVLQHPSVTVLGMQKGNEHKAVIYNAPKPMPTLE